MLEMYFSHCSVVFSTIMRYFSNVHTEIDDATLIWSSFTHVLTGLVVAEGQGAPVVGLLEPGHGVGLQGAVPGTGGQVPHLHGGQGLLAHAHTASDQ